jgi:signal peptidase I
MNTQKPRNPLMAALMSLILPGFGQLYNGEVNRGLLLFIGFALCSIPLMVLIALYLPSSLMLPMLVLANVVAIGLWIYGIGNAWKTARALKEYTLKTWQKAGVYLAVFLCAMLFIFPSMIQYVRTNLVESFYLPSSSMEPSVLRGDVIFANKQYNKPSIITSSIKRGDIGIFVYPNNRTQQYIKRIIALPGDKIEIQNQQVFINGKALSRGEPGQNKDHLIVTEKQGDKEYQVQWLASDTDTMLQLTVPPGEVFVLGDNRSASNDSRKFGTVPMRDVAGKAGQIWFSKGEDGIRWDRLGQLLR